MKRYSVCLMFLLIILLTAIFTGCSFGKTITGPTNKPIYNYDPPVIVENPTIGSRSESLDFIFNNQTLGETTIVIKRSEWNKLCDDYRYFYKNENCVCADSFIYEKDGSKWVINNVALRLRGNTSRYCPQGLDNGREQNQMNKDWNGTYYDTEGIPNDHYRQSHFKVDFEEFASDGSEVKLSGCMKGVALKRMDSSCTREIFCYDMFHRYGIWTAPRASHTKVTIKMIEDVENPSATEPTTTVNYGVYEMFEEVNKQSLKARDKDENTSENAWKNSKGNLWKCANDLTTGRINEMGVEDIIIIHSYEPKPSGFQKNGRENGDRIGYVWKQYSMDLKTNKDSFNSASNEFRGFITELNALPTVNAVNGSNDAANINKIKAFYEKWFDVDFFIKTYAVNILCGMDDDYWGNANNFYLYFDTGKNGTGKVYLIPFDYDNTLGCSISEGGFMHDPMDWGRGRNRPLIDKLLMVPEYKAKFVNYLLEVSAENSEWNFEDCSARFLAWKDMVKPYLYSEDLKDGRQGTLEWGDWTTWQPSGYSLTNRANNVFDATRLFFRLNLGAEVEGMDSATVNEQVRNPDESTYSAFELSVTAKNDGLHITKSHDAVWDHVAIHIYDINDSVENARIATNQNVNEFVYPFVEKGHLYKVWLTLQSAACDWYYTDAKDYGISVIVLAEGGVGNYRITNSGYSYSSSDYSIILTDLKIVRPDGLVFEDERIEGNIYDGGNWKGNSIWVGGLRLQDSITNTILYLSEKAEEFVSGKNIIFCHIDKKFTYKGINYEYTVVENYDNFFSDSSENPSAQPPASDWPTEIKQSTTGSSSDPDGKKVSKTVSLQNPDDVSYSNCTISVTPKYNGLYIEKTHNSFWDHVEIRIRDKTNNRDNVWILTDQNHNAFLYPFVQKDNEYEIWFNMQSEQYNWNWKGFENETKVTVTAVGGLGNYWISCSDYSYHSPSYSIVLSDLTFGRPDINVNNSRFDGAIYYNDKWTGTAYWPGNIPLVKSVLDLSSERAHLKGQQTIFIRITYKFVYDGTEYQQYLMENYGRLFRDTN